MSVKVKICGITSVADAQLAADAGADFIGMIFARSSPRAVSLEKAEEICAGLRGKVKLVGVFRGDPPGRVRSLLDSLGLDMAQYHGGEPLSLIEAVGYPAIRVVEIGEAPVDWREVAGGGVEHILFDRPKGLADERWLAGAVACLRGCPLPLPPYFFAGGLNADNVAGLVRELAPYGVDVASGVETAPGVKDPAALRNFVRAAKEVGPS